MSDPTSDDANSGNTNKSSPTAPKRLAIIGGGSSGLICLKNAIDFLPDWEIVCFEKSDSVIGCWGNPYPGFVSTSTCYTTQFACYPICDASMEADGETRKSEFFRGGQYGEYLNAFVDHFDLRKHIRLNTHVQSLRRQPGGGWQVTLSGSVDDIQHFDAVVICIGVAATPKEIRTDIPTLSAKDLNQPTGLGHITDKTIVVVGGGESAVDYADRLAKVEQNNRVYLSLKTGVRVSPRYHPIRGVPSDFLRNRLMLSIHPDIRNWLGQVFVEARISYEQYFQRFFPAAESQKAHGSGSAQALDAVQAQRRKDWTLKLTQTAKDGVFNMYHNKSDDFLLAVGEQRIQIVGPPVADDCRIFRTFDEQADERVEVDPDLIVPAIGYRSELAELTGGEIKVEDFYLASVHVDFADLFLVGFARPIIGNIPTISEMQTRWVCGLLSGDFTRPQQLKRLNQSDRKRRTTRYAKIDLESSFPVEMFTYCDRLATLTKLKATPSLFRSPRKWWNTLVSPATTLHYFQNQQDVTSEPAKRYMPAALVLLLVLLKPLDWIYRLIKAAIGNKEH